MESPAFDAAPLQSQEENDEMIGILLSLFSISMWVVFLAAAITAIILLRMIAWVLAPVLRTIIRISFKTVPSQRAIARGEGKDRA